MKSKNSSDQVSSLEKYFNFLIPTCYDGFKSVSTLKTWREVPPSHYILKIESFSSLEGILEKTKVDNYESNEFEASGYTWRLLLYPRGDQERNGSDHISLYLKIMYPPPEMNALLIFFIYDQLKDKYLSIQDVEVRQFNKTNRVWGLSQLVSLDCFRNTSNGFLVNDSCVFGVEVFDIKCDEFEVQGVYLRTLRQQSEIVKIWTVEKLSELKETGHFSEQFSVGGYNWKFHLYPKGAPKAKGKCLSIYLCLQDQDKFPPGWKMHVEFKLSINDQVHENNSDRITKIGNAWFSALDTAWGFPCFIKLADLRRSTSHFFRDAMEIELQIISMSTSLTFFTGFYKFLLDYQPSPLHPATWFYEFLVRFLRPPSLPSSQLPRWPLLPWSQLPPSPSLPWPQLPPPPSLTLPSPSSLPQQSSSPPLSPRPLSP